MSSGLTRSAAASPSKPSPDAPTPSPRVRIATASGRCATVSRKASAIVVAVTRRTWGVVVLLSILAILPLEPVWRSQSYRRALVLAAAAGQEASACLAEAAVLKV